MILTILCLFLPSLHATISRMHVISQPGSEFLPIDSSELLLSTMAPNRRRCAIACHNQWACRTFDYDSISQRCRLYEGDLTTGSIVTSSSASSIVMSIELSSNTCASTHNQPCEACIDSRYEQCLNNICQCPPRTYWNGSECLLQLFQNQTCTQADACRKDFNLTCLPTYINTFTYCAVTTVPVGTTVAGQVDGTAGSATDSLSTPRGLAVINNGTTLIVADAGNARVLSFNLLQKSTGSVIMTTPSGQYPSYVMAYQNSIYVGNPAGSLVQILPSNATIPLSAPYLQSCSLQYFNAPSGISMDSNGSIYVAGQGCHWITRWTGAIPSSVAGISGSYGSTSQQLYFPSGISIDQQYGFLYVADSSNHRIQRFDLDGSNIGITVAGGYGPGPAAYQLSNPLDVCVSQKNGAIYIADYGNNRVQRWDINATAGVTVAGDPAGSPGVTPTELNGPFAITLDPINEAFLYVSDFNNNRILQFPLT
ncbi:unnamed protein product [Adineta steineri]|uniref:Apple domain-containing protein n=1 Tax=Adineta steineri TaxID=433720 RepID=A0A814FD09_9BILA|nr:unnamed protein product [Adineta steineri]